MYVCKNNSTSYFTHLPRSPPWKDLHLNWRSGSFRGHNQHNQLWQFFSQSVEGFKFCRGPNFPISHWLSRSPLTQCCRYRTARDYSAQMLNVVLATAFLTVLPSVTRRYCVKMNERIAWHRRHWRVARWLLDLAIYGSSTYSPGIAPSDDVRRNMGRSQMRLFDQLSYLWNYARYGRGCY